MIDYSDKVPFQDQLSVLNKKEIDIILETPGGIAEVTDDLVRQLREKYEKVGIIVPGWAKSAGTIFAMAGDEILMGPTSALGPIDPQLAYQNGRKFSADAFLDGLEKIKNEVSASGKLNPSYIPILQNISPGEIENCHNAREFSQELVRNWLEKYKFKYWDIHESSGKPVTEEEKKKRAKEIAAALCQHKKWLTHGRSIRLPDLAELKLKITDYSKDQSLNDAISRYHTLLMMSFDMINAYKIFETPTTQIMKLVATQAQPDSPPANSPSCDVDFSCPKCKSLHRIQVNFRPLVPLREGRIKYPKDDKLICRKCGAENNLQPIRLNLEAQIGKKAI